MEVGDFPLPDPEEFCRLMETLSAAEKRWQALTGAVEPEKLARLYDVPEADLEACKVFLRDLEKEIISASRALGEASKQVLTDLLLDQGIRWRKFIQGLEPLLGQIREACHQVGAVRVELPEGIERTKLLGDARRRLEHFKRGGRRGFGIFAPKVVRETRYIEEKCWVDGQSPREPEALQILVTARKRPRQPGTQPEPYESWFEVDVALELLRRGYRVKPQFEVSGYRIDLVVEGLENRLAVECDGDAWHGPEHFERDMTRQRQLERAGWNFVRIRESEFYADRRRALQLIEEKCAELNIYPAV